jgi:hypothetical protein
MTNAIDHDGNRLPDAERLTRFGRRLRSASLDELPELINRVEKQKAESRKLKAEIRMREELQLSAFRYPL